MSGDRRGDERGRDVPGHVSRIGTNSLIQADSGGVHTPAPKIGGSTLTERLGRGGAAGGRGAERATDSAAVHEVADRGMSGTAGTLPHMGSIQRLFGPSHDLSGIRSYVGGPAAAAATEIGAQAYARGDQVAFSAPPSLHTAAHEAAHVVQQRAGVHLKSGVGEVGDAYEQNADAVAERVVQGMPAHDLLPGATSMRRARPATRRSKSSMSCSSCR